jgi:protocatechuate 3,4-dioxygenase beta subunit
VSKVYSEYQDFIGQKPTATAGAAPGKLEPTGADILGPFWTLDSPERNTLCDDPTFTLTGRVLNTDGRPLSGVLLDFWQADEEGKYDEHGPGFRGRQESAFGGAYTLHTVKPGYYKISEPGQPDDYRCSHIHVKVSAPGFVPLTTQLYFKDSAFDDTDHWFDARRCVKESADGASATFDFVLAPEGE